MDNPKEFLTFYDLLLNEEVVVIRKSNPYEAFGMASALPTASTAARLFKISTTFAVMTKCNFDVSITLSCTLTRKLREKPTDLQFDLNICAKAINNSKVKS